MVVENLRIEVRTPWTGVTRVEIIPETGPSVIVKTHDGRWWINQPERSYANDLYRLDTMKLMLDIAAGIARDVKVKQ